MKLKKLPNLILGVCITLTAHAYEVPTTQQKKNILLEEYTGIHCGYCPQGHTIAKNMQMAQPEFTYVIAIHSGEYSNPSPDEPDFRTEDGDIINKGIGAAFYSSGYPSGTINRHIFERDAPIVERARWTKCGKNMMQEDAPVNLLLKSTFDGKTRQLDITLEGYYTQDVADQFNLINVALVQNDIIGPQNGGLVGSDYIHNHMLRDYITPTWGDTIKAPKQGEYFTRFYTYTLPNDLKGVELKPEDIEVIAFVCENKLEVLNVTGGKPTYTNYDKTLNATILPANRDIKTNYGFSFFEANLKNESNQAITSAEFDVKMDGKSQIVNWTGTIHSFEKNPIILKVNPYDLAQRCEYSITLTKLNGQAVTGNSISGSFNNPSESTAQIDIEFQTDLYADENIFVIKDQDGNIVKEFGPYESNKKAIYKEKASLEQGKIYCFEITDKWVDGIQEPRGYYKLSNSEDKSMLFQQYDIKLFGDRFFFKTSLTSDIVSSTNETATKVISNLGNLEVSFAPASSGTTVIELYSATGQKIESYTVSVNAKEMCTQNISTDMIPKGIYFIRICENEKTQTIKTMIK